MFRLAFILLPLCLYSFSAQANELKPFVSDGCSAFPDGTLFQQQLWLKCCTDHDYSYWKGGTYQERLDADKELDVCVSKVGEPAVAKIMLAGVRVGGSPLLPTSFRWGYGWPYPKWYGVLTKAEQNKIDLLTNKKVTR